MSTSRKWLLVLLAVAASFSVVLAAIWVASGRGGDRLAGRGDTRAPRGTPPKVSFAPGASSGNPEVDAFVAEFINLCRRGDYEQYRLCWTAYGTPVSGERFQAMWKFARSVVISEITPLPETVKAMHPAYLIKAQVQIDPGVRTAAKDAVRDVELMVQREENRWAIAPAPRMESTPDTLPFMDTSPASQPEAPSAQRG